MRRWLLALALAGCGTPTTTDAGSDASASQDAVADAAQDVASGGRPCVPACPSLQTCVDGACYAPVLQRLAFTLSNPQQLSLGQMLPFRVSAVYSNSEMRDVSISAMLTLSEQNSVRFGSITNDQPSLVGVAAGEAVLTARYGGAEGTARIVVAGDARIARVQVDPPTLTIGVGGRGQLRLLAVHVDGTMEPAVGAVAWANSAQSLLEVSGATSVAMLRGTGQGTAMVTGTLGALSSTAIVTIR